MNRYHIIHAKINLNKEMVVFVLNLPLLRRYLSVLSGGRVKYRSCLRNNKCYILVGEEGKLTDFHL